MSEWKKVKLGEVLTIKYGKDHKKITAGNYPIYGSGGIMRYGNECLYNDESILIPRKGSLNNLFYVNEPFWTVDTLFWSIPNKKEINVKFTFYQLRLINFAGMNVGSAVPSLTTKVLNEIEISLPPLDEQVRIAEILGSLDDKIELNNRINKNLEEQAQALFKRWFVDFEFPDANGNPYKSSGGDFIDSELGQIPKDWKVDKLTSIANITMGQSPAGSSYNENKVGEVFYQGRAEFGNRFPTRRLYTTEPKRMADDNSILMSVRAPVGDINIAYEHCCIGRGLASISSKTSHNSFILYTMYSLYKQLNQFNGEGTVFGSINKDSLANLKVLTPTEKYIVGFDEIVASFDSQIKINFFKNKNLSDLRNSLLPKLMTNQIKL